MEWLDELKAYINALKNSTHEKFLKKVYGKNHNFDLSKQTNTNNSNLNQNVMNSLPKADMKNLILTAAVALMKENGKTTNLDIKNRLRAENPGLWIDQATVSQFMDELTHETTEWNRDNSASGGRWYEYTPIQVVSSDEDEVDDTTLALPASTTATSNPANLTSIVSNNGKATVLGKIGDNSQAFLNNLDPKVRVAYAAGFDPMLTNTTDKNEARKLYNQAVPGAKWDDIRMITLDTYLTRNNLKN